MLNRGRRGVIGVPLRRRSRTIIISYTREASWILFGWAMAKIISPYNLYLNPVLVVKQYQIWLLITNFLYFRKMDLDFLFHMFFLARYCKLLEENSFRGRTADFFYMLLFGATVLTSIVLVGGMIPYVSESFAKIIFLSNSLTFMMVIGLCLEQAKSIYSYELLGPLYSGLLTMGILLKGLYEIWGEGSSYEELKEAINSYPDDRKLPYLTSDSTFRIIIDSFGKAIPFKDQTDRIKGMAYIPFQGRVDLRNPEHKFWLIETDDYGTNNGLPPVVDKRIFFGREVGAADRKLLPTYQLKSRNYLGPTAMDAEVAFLMANQAQAMPGKLVYDPFVGTGSILVAAAHFGAMTMGADIDIRVVRDGRGPDCNVWSNFKQYGLQMPISLLRADNNLPPWRPGLKEMFDAIICDPPYGVRAGGRKSGGRKLLKGVVGPYTVPDEKRTGHIPSTASYSLAECVHDLLDLAAKMLVMGGRLVYFYPVLRDSDTLDVNFPEHPCFKLIASCEQMLSYRYSRVLLTMVKIAPYTDEIAAAAQAQHLDFKENHLKWLEEGNLHAAVFSPEFPLVDDGDSLSSKDSKKKYRGKYV